MTDRCSKEILAWFRQNQIGPSRSRLWPTVARRCWTPPGLDGLRHWTRSTRCRDEKVLDDNWSIKDLIAHALFWDAEVLTDIERWQHGRPPVSNHWQRMNDENQWR